MAFQFESLAARELAAEQGFAQQRPASFGKLVGTGFFFTSDFDAALRFVGC